jgi:hypothetical protein
MKILFLKLLILAAAVSFYSCEEDFNLKTDHKPAYSLNCIIRADTSFHMATISKSYMVDGFDPYENREDPFISGADIRLWQKDDVYFFRDTLVERKDTSRYDFLQKSYYIKDYTPSENDLLEIKAILGNGKIMKGFTKIPRRVKWDTTSTPALPPDGGGADFQVRWQKNNNFGWFILRMQIRYKKSGIYSPTESRMVPLYYKGDTPVYPVPSKNSGLLFQWSAFDRAMREISNGQPDKSQIIVYGILLELLILDDNLSKYYSNLNGYMDDFTIRVDQNDFSNIEGGLGIFGSYIKQSGGMVIKKEYVESLGYRKP